MTRSTPLALAVAAVLLAACGAEGTTQIQPGAGKTPDAPKANNAAKPAPVAPAKWTSVDAKGHDWAAQMGSMRFDTNWQAAMARGKASGRPVLLLFTEKTSPDAAKIAATFKDPRVIAATGEFEVAIVDNDDNGPLAERYGVKGVPMIVYADPAGEALGATIGVNADELLADLKSALTTMKEDAEEAK